MATGCTKDAAVRATRIPKTNEKETAPPSRAEGSRQEGIFAEGALAAGATSGLAQKILAGQTVAGIGGSAPVRLENCTADGAVGCVTTEDHESAR